MTLEDKAKEDAKENVLPMEYRGGWETFINLPNRFVTLIWKVIGWKGLFTLLTYSLIKDEVIPEAAVPYVWIALMLIAIFGEKALEVIKDIKK